MIREPHECCDECGITGDNKTNALVEVRTCNDKGVGVFALKDVAVGGEILREKPLAMYDNGVDFENLGISQRKRKLIGSLHDAFAISGGGKSYGGITKTNGLPANDGKQGLFCLACRLNHACNGAQNARYIWRNDLGKMMARAIRPIKRGEEILVNYIDPYLCREERQKRLWDGFRFKCACDECTTKWSKSRDEKLEEIRQSIEDYIPVAQFEPKRALGLVEKALETLEMEGLNTPHDLGTIHYHAFQIADKAFDVDKRRFHLKKAHECWLQTEGGGSRLDLMGKDIIAYFEK